VSNPTPIPSKPIENGVAERGRGSCVRATVLKVEFMSSLVVMTLMAAGLLVFLRPAAVLA
jgi:hypothetical protein